jgi:hypothetical protein
MTPSRLARSLAPLALAGAACSTHALEPYVATGFPYALAGVSQAFGDRFALRADFGTAAHHSYSGSTSDENYRGKVNYSRLALLGDWFAFGNGFRLTGGATFNDAKATIRATARGGSIVLGGTVFTVPSDDAYYVDSEVKVPDVTPYVGLGWGHHEAAGAAGFRFAFDLGASIGTAKASPLTPSKPLADVIAATPGGSNALATEDQRLHDEVSKLKAVPQLTIGVGYRF